MTTALTDAPDDLKCRLLEADLLLYDGREIAPLLVQTHLTYPPGWKLNDWNFT